jgi:hypothetical protein
VRKRGTAWGLPRGLPLLLGAVVLVGVVAFAFGPKVERKVLGKAAPGVNQLTRIDQLQAAFNADSGSTRVVMIFSPT